MPLEPLAHVGRQEDSNDPRAGPHMEIHVTTTPEVRRFITFRDVITNNGTNGSNANDNDAATTQATTTQQQQRSNEDEGNNNYGNDTGKNSASINSAGDNNAVATVVQMKTK